MNLEGSTVDVRIQNLSGGGGSSFGSFSCDSAASSHIVKEVVVLDEIPMRFPMRYFLGRHPTGNV